MNRQKKIKQTLKKLAKKEKAKNAPKNKPRYISKAEREALQANDTIDTEQATVASPK